MNRRDFGAVAAVAAFTLLAAGAAATTAFAAQDVAVKCAGINNCKGESECQTATSSCKGENQCKGQGWVTKKSAAECEAAGGHVIA